MCVLQSWEQCESPGNLLQEILKPAHSFTQLCTQKQTYCSVHKMLIKVTKEQRSVSVSIFHKHALPTVGTTKSSTRDQRMHPLNDKGLFKGP